MAPFDIKMHPFKPFRLLLSLYHKYVTHIVGDFTQVLHGIQTIFIV
jgi:hypothetical protein